MTTLLAKKDYKIIWISAKNPEKVIIELDRDTLSHLISTRKRTHNKNTPLLDYIKSWEIDNPDNISGTYSDINNLISDLNKLW